MGEAEERDVGNETAGAGRGVRTCVRLSPRSSSPRITRRLVRQTCAASGLPDKLVDDAALVAGELVTTSLRQVHAPLLVDLSIVDDVVTVRVRDSGTQPPGGLGDRPAAERSWDLVRRLGTSWGYHHGPDSREMWASFRVAQRPVAEPCP